MTSIAEKSQLAAKRFRSRLNFAAGANCRVILDRVRGVCHENPAASLLDITGIFRIQSRRIARPSDSRFQAYDRAEWFRDRNSDMKISVESERAKPWLWPYRITFVADDATGLLPRQVFGVIERLPNFHLTMLEIAFDFAAELTRREVLQRVLFGKTRPSGSQGYAAYWGSRGK